MIWVVFENHSYSQIIGASSAPYFNQLASQCGLATNFHAETHPSLPNYIAMTSGSTQGITDDNGPGSHPLNVPSIFSQLPGGRSRSLEESMPSNCLRSNSGRYAVRHNPEAYYTNLGSDCANFNVPLLPAALNLSADFTFITPDLCSDMHDCSIATGDAWLATLMSTIFASPEYQSGSTAVFITFDEDNGSEGNRVATLVVSPHTPAGARSATAFNHYAMLRTTEELLGITTYLGGAASAPSMRVPFGL